jgi:hypothetical protein
VFAGTGTGVEAFDVDLAEAGIVPNVGPAAALINPPKSGVTENADCPTPLATADGVCYAGAVLTGNGLSL